jgi:NAD+ kinase
MVGSAEGEDKAIGLTGQRLADVEHIAIVAAPTPAGQAAREALEVIYPAKPPADADVIVALGGDGFMLQTIHRFIDQGKPIYGMNRGSVGFMMNPYKAENLIESIRNAEVARLHPLSMAAQLDEGGRIDLQAMNEVSMLRQTRQAAKLRISVDGVVRLGEMTCDGVLVATPISVFRPRRWRGALIPRDSRIRIEVLESQKRPVSATADSTEVRDVVEIEIAENREITVEVLFEAGQSLSERNLAEQFSL